MVFRIPGDPQILPGIIALGVAKSEEEASAFLNYLVFGAIMGIQNGLDQEYVIRMMMIMGYYLGTLNQKKDVNTEVN